MLPQRGSGVLLSRPPRDVSLFLRPSRGGPRSYSPSTGSAALHPWLHPCAPLGREPTPARARSHPEFPQLLVLLAQVLVLLARLLVLLAQFFLLLANFPLLLARFFLLLANFPLLLAQFFLLLANILLRLANILLRLANIQQQPK